MVNGENRMGLAMGKKGIANDDGGGVGDGFDFGVRSHSVLCLGGRGASSTRSEVEVRGMGGR